MSIWKGWARRIVVLKKADQHSRRSLHRGPYRFCTVYRETLENLQWLGERIKTFEAQSAATNILLVRSTHARYSDFFEVAFWAAIDQRFRRAPTAELTSVRRELQAVTSTNCSRCPRCPHRSTCDRSFKKIAFALITGRSKARHK